MATSLTYEKCSRSENTVGSWFIFEGQNFESGKLDTNNKHENAIVLGSEFSVT